MGFNCLNNTEPLQGDGFLLPLNPQEVLLLIYSNSEGWKAEWTLEPPSGFEPGNHGLGIQRLDHYAIAP